MDGFYQLYLYKLFHKEHSTENMSHVTTKSAYKLPKNGYSFSLLFPHFLTVLLFFMNMQMRLFSYRTRSSIYMSYDITGSITKCHNDILGLKLVYLWGFKDFSAIFYFFININEYANKSMCITYHRKKL